MNDVVCDSQQLSTVESRHDTILSGLSIALVLIQCVYKQLNAMVDCDGASRVDDTIVWNVMHKYLIGSLIKLGEHFILYHYTSVLTVRYGCYKTTNIIHG